MVERLCGRLDPSAFAVARVSTTQVAPDDLLRLAADALGAPMEGNKASVLRGIGDALRIGTQRHLLIVDEAQALPFGALEELRMLSNLTRDLGEPLLQTVLLGQPQLRRTLASPDLLQFRQRILASYHLAGLASPEETGAYVEHRMRAVGWDGTPGWEDGALDGVHRHSDGIPRRINRLCSRVLLAGALEGASVLTGRMVESTAEELDEDLGAGRFAPRPTEPDEDSLARRVTSLEAALKRHERVLGRMGELFGVPGRTER